MTSTELKIGLTNSARPSSRVLKPPGGGHSDIFAEPDVSINAPRPKYNQQNSSNLNACMGSTDANIVVEKLREDMTKQTAEIQSRQNEPTDKSRSGSKGSEHNANKNVMNSTNGDGEGQASRGRIPPGGYSSGGFW